MAQTRRDKLARQAFGNSLIVRTLNDQIDNQTLLYNLSLVNRKYNHIFNKGLYEFLFLGSRFYEYVQDEKNMECLVRSNLLRYTKYIVVLDGINKYKNGLPVKIRESEYNDFILKIVTHTPNVISYRSRGFSPGARLLKSLADLRHLRSLAIEFPAAEVMYQEYHARDIDHSIFDSQQLDFSCDGKIYADAAIYLPLFTNLHKLSLLGVASVGGDAGIWRAAILRTLLQSPNLRHLRLSKGYDPFSERYWDGDENPWNSLLEWLCEQYHQTTGRPVRLDSLVIGNYIRYPQEAVGNGTLKMSKWAERSYVPGLDDDVGRWISVPNTQDRTRLYVGA